MPSGYYVAQQAGSREVQALLFMFFFLSFFLSLRRETSVSKDPTGRFFPSVVLRIAAGSQLVFCPGENRVRGTSEGPFL